MTAATLADMWPSVKYVSYVWTESVPAWGLWRIIRHDAKEGFA